MNIDVMKQALEALEHIDSEDNDRDFLFSYQCTMLDAAITALRTAIEQAEKQEPVAYAVYHRMGGSKTLHWPEQHSEDGDAKEYKLVPLYTTPPAAPVQERNFCERCGKRLGDGHIHTCTPPEAQRQWVGLAPHEIGNLWAFAWAGDRVAFACAIEAKLKEKNT